MSVSHNSHHIHHFLRNKEMNEMYLSYGIFNFALGLISVFIPIYLYNIGYSISEILIFFFLNSLAFIAFSYLGVKIVSRFGAKHSMLISGFALILFLLGMRFIETWPLLFFILPIVRAFKMILYNYSFHLNFIRHSDRSDRGKQVSMIQASAVLADIISPFIGGLILHFSNFPILFVIGSFCIFLAMVPLFMTEETYEPISFEKGRLFTGIFEKKNLPLVASFSGYAIESWIGLIIWPVFLYLLFSNFESVGNITSLTAFVTLIIFYFVGKLTDKKDKRLMLGVGTVLYFFAWLGRIFVNGFSSVMLVDSYKNVTQQILFVPWSAYSYDLAAERNYFKFIVRREVVFNLSRVLVLPLLALIFYIDFHPFTFSFMVAAAASLFYLTLGDKNLIRKRR